ncbi:GNAT family N-acetyltransferase [candidate division WOR-3 bacterium]|jgi:GNAT superfamily N-acetyltransferase|nr:GNAT family N-acetyltransferase [candidate division WOR-3 bacterium]
MNPIRLPNHAPAVEKAVSVLAGAFMVDPLWKNLFPQNQKRFNALSSVLHLLIRYGLNYGWVNTNPEITAVALWLPSDRTRPHLLNSFSSEALILPFRLGFKPLRLMLKFDRFQNQLHRQVIVNPHRYLALLGVAPEHQGKGFGTALLQVGIEEALKHNQSIYIDTTNERNIPFYERFGFELVKSLPLSEPRITLFGLLYKPQP